MTAAPPTKCQPESRELRRPPFDAVQILLGVIAVAFLGSAVISLAFMILYVVGETVEHFTP